MARRQKIPPKESAAKQIFRRKEFVLSGDFKPKCSHEQLERWIQCHGGKIARKVSKSTNLLICTIKNYKNRVPEVLRALEIGSARCQIITWDWVEDCLLPVNGQQKRLLPTNAYQLHNVGRRLIEAEKEKVRHAAKFKKTGEDFKELADPAFWHVYLDQTGFEYKVILTRITKGIKIKYEKYILYLFESHTIPRQYMHGGRLKPGTGRPWVCYREKCTPTGDFEPHFRQFKNTFEKKTGVPWDERYDGKKPEGDDKFVFVGESVTSGRPLGILPAGWEPPKPESESDSSSQSESSDEENANSDRDLFYTSTSDGDEDDDDEGDDISVSRRKAAAEEPLITVNPYTTGVTLSDLKWDMVEEV